MKPIHCLRGSSGLSLVEVLIALSILSIGLLAVASMQFSSDFLSRNSSDVTSASNMASDQMERLMLLPFTHADLSPGTVTRTSGKYTIRWQVTEEDMNADGTNDAKAIDLTVSWATMLSQGSSQRQVKMAFLKHDSL